ncbi:MAG: glycosyltransferase family 2 protein [Sulfuricurvum sp.]|nr:glycosyltransferase family 2 protein [Sulfuricurvum sp.]
MSINKYPSVSIGMPVYNGETFIREALDSLLSQTFTDFELIISDNGSTDRTEAICREYAAKDERIRYIRQPENRGAIGNFQFVLDEAAGEYFMWAAADDKWSPNWIEILLQIILTHTNTSAFGKVVTIDKNGHLLDHPVNNRDLSFSGNKLFRRLKYFFELESFGKANIIYGLFKLKDIKKLQLNAFEFDYNIVYDILQTTEFHCSQKAVLYKRIHDNNEAQSSTEQEQGKRSIIEKIMRFLRLPIERKNMYLSGYITHSTPLERILLILLYPFKIIFFYSNAFKSAVQIKLTKKYLSCL